MCVNCDDLASALKEKRQQAWLGNYPETPVESNNLEKASASYVFNL